MNCIDILQGTIFLNEQLGIQHCNLSPENIFITSQGRWKIGGLGFQIKKDNESHSKYKFIHPNWVYVNLDYYYKNNMKTDLHSATLILYNIFAKLNNRSNILPDKINSQEEARSY